MTHIYGDPERYAMSPGRTYTPEPALVPEMRALHRALHVDRVVIVHPTVYGVDNTCTLHAIAELSPNARGIAVVDANTPPARFDEMYRAGMRGIRINLETVGLTDPAIARQRFQTAVEQVRGLEGWHIQIYTRPSVIEGIYDLLEASPVTVAFDHFGGAQAATAMRETGFGLLLNLLRAGKVYVKLSAPYLVSKLGPEYPDVVPLARALVEANRERILWGTNWPHPFIVHDQGRKPTEISPLRQMDDGEIFNLLPLWVPDSADRKLILVDNPARLYGF